MKDRHVHVVRFQTLGCGPAAVEVVKQHMETAADLYASQLERLATTSNGSSSPKLATVSPG